MQKKDILVTTGESRTADAIVRILLERKDMQQHVNSVKVTCPQEIDNPDLSELGAHVINLPVEDVGDCGPEELVETFRGAHVVILIPPADEKMVLQVENYIEAMKIAGIKNVILISAQGCTSGKRRLGEFLKMEQMARRMMPDVDLCCLRPGQYMQNFFIYAVQMREEGYLGIPLGDGKFAPIDVRDLAMCAAKVAVSGDRDSIASEHLYQTYTLTGIELCSGKDIVQIAQPYLQKVGMSGVNYVSISKAKWFDYIKKEVPDMSSSERELLDETFDLIREGKMEEISQDVSRICADEKVTTLAEFFEEYADEVFGKEE